MSSPSQSPRSKDSAHSYQWLPGAIYPPELDWLSENLESAKADILIECGRQDGASARWYHENLNPNIQVYSIDLDDRPEILENSKKNLDGTNVIAVTGDVFEKVPEIIRANPDKRIAILEDAVKGWPGLCLLLSCVFYDNVVLLAQHNLHEGHNTKILWEGLGGDTPVFLEQSPSETTAQSMKKWVQAHGQMAQASNRDSNISSLGLLHLSTQKRTELFDFMLANKALFRHWDPVSFRQTHGGKEKDFAKRNFRKEYYLRFTRPQR